MPAATVNALSTDQLAGLSVDSVSSLLSNPNAASFSSVITSSLKTAVGLSISSVTMEPDATNMTNPTTQTPPPKTNPPSKTNPHSKTNPPSAPVNAFESVADKRFPQILLAMYPGNYTPATAAVNSATQNVSAAEFIFQTKLFSY